MVKRAFEKEVICILNTAKCTAINWRYSAKQIIIECTAFSFETRL